MSISYYADTHYFLCKGGENVNLEEYTDRDFDTEEYLSSIEEEASISTESLKDTIIDIAKTGAKTAINQFVTPSQQDAVRGLAYSGVEKGKKEGGKFLRKFDKSPKGELRRQQATLDSIDKEYGKHVEGGLKGYRQRNKGNIKKMRDKAKYIQHTAKSRMNADISKLKWHEKNDLIRAIDPEERKAIKAMYALKRKDIGDRYAGQFKTVDELKKKSGRISQYKSTKDEYNKKKEMLGTLLKTQERRVANTMNKKDPHPNRNFQNMDQLKAANAKRLEKEGIKTGAQSASKLRSIADRFKHEK